MLIPWVTLSISSNIQNNVITWKYNSSSNPNPDTICLASFSLLVPQLLLPAILVLWWIMSYRYMTRLIEYRRKEMSRPWWKIKGVFFLTKLNESYLKRTARRRSIQATRWCFPYHYLIFQFPAVKMKEPYFWTNLYDYLYEGKRSKTIEIQLCYYYRRLSYVNIS